MGVLLSLFSVLFCLGFHFCFKRNHLAEIKISQGSIFFEIKIQAQGFTLCPKLHSAYQLCCFKSAIHARMWGWALSIHGEALHRSALGPYGVCLRTLSVMATTPSSEVRFCCCCCFLLFVFFTLSQYFRLCGHFLETSLYPHFTAWHQT